MVEGLPPDGALARAITGSPWGTTEYQLASILDRLGRMEVDFRNANRPEKTSPAKYPDREWRPGDPVPKTPKQKAKAARKDRREARGGYLRLVGQLTPQYVDQA
ncbi:hypothetical protein [Streptomyces sp. NPDC057509]|uniref:hypothetical protein n=1 Tax=Streptomyces sp. NPDC057509 TaxID=3346152 RepID=UPI00368F041A